MWNIKNLLALPPTLLVLFWSHPTFASSEADFTLEVDDVSEALWRRDVEAQSRLQRQQPQGIKKMSDDPGEKFWYHYWEFDEQELLSSNYSILEQPFALHGSSTLFARNLFLRDGTCPTNTTSCASIGYPNSCCPNGNTCITVQDTGNGPVGCCPSGQTCGNTISGCNTAQGYSSCPNSNNKGCCIPGYQCSGDICINIGTQTVTASPSTTSTSTTTVSSTSQPISVVTVVSVNTSGFTTTATVTTTVTPSSSSSSTTSSGSAVAPVRPTTSSSSDTTVAPAAVSSTSSTTITTTTTAVAGYCPTGYYMCSAVYLGGCCQVGRDCNTTSCPSTASTTVISGSPTVVAPAGNTANNFCASGWYSCAASLGGNCCPNGFSCATSNCVASVSGVPDTAKETPSEASITRTVSCLITIAFMSGIGMMIL